MTENVSLTACTQRAHTNRKRHTHETQFQEPTMDMLTMTLQSVQLDRGDTNKYPQYKWQRDKRQKFSFDFEQYWRIWLTSEMKKKENNNRDKSKTRWLRDILRRHCKGHNDEKHNNNIFTFKRFNWIFNSTFISLIWSNECRNEIFHCEKLIKTIFSGMKAWFWTICSRKTQREMAIFSNK